MNRNTSMKFDGLKTKKSGLLCTHDRILKKEWYPVTDSNRGQTD